MIKNVKKYLYNMTVHQRLVMLAALGPLFLGILMLIFSTRIVLKSYNNSKQVMANTASKALIEKIDRNFYERFAGVQAFAYNKLALQSVQADSAVPGTQELLNTFTSYYVLYDLMMICDINGKVLAVNTIDKNGTSIHSSALLSKNFSSETWFKVCTTAPGPDGGAWYSDFMVSNDAKSIYNNNGHGMAFAAPIKDQSGNIQGVWYNFASWEAITEAIRKEAERELKKTEPFAQLLITNEDGVLISSSYEELIGKANFTKETIEAGATLLGEKYGISEKTHVIGMAEGTGAYTYKGKNWKCMALIPRENFSILTLVDRDILALLMFTLFGIVVSCYAGIRFGKSISGNIEKMKEVVDKISQGELVKTDIKDEDELGAMAHSLNLLTDELHKKVEFAEQIGKGNFSSEFSPSGPKDMLGISLLNMRNNLLKASTEEEKRAWITAGVANISDIIRQNHENEQNLYDRTLAFIVEYINANQGALFVLNDNDEKDHHMEMVACYAYHRKKYINKKIYYGEGLVGQAWFEKDKIFRTEIPQDYVTITSGLGEAKPRCLVLFPLKINEEVYGVLEIAAFKELDAFEMEFLSRISETLASAVSIARANMVTKKLIESTQQQAEELRAQEEEMRQNMEELAATQEEMQRKEIEYMKKIQELEAQLSKIK
ncbi:MAG: GAF domain-containing protein [Cytophagaceae bacterium]|nr:GAF domain-containing protein [Cytophagaceae bacterium]MDW8456194.1 GAF domain-containing protein [Cytophagaceae bacterium]